MMQRPEGTVLLPAVVPKVGPCNRHETVFAAWQFPPFSFIYTSFYYGRY